MIDRFETFATNIAAIHRNVQKIKTQEMNALGLKGTHGMCLYVLGKNPEGLTSAQLCRFVKEDKAAVSRALNDLTGKGYVCSDYEPEEKRAYRSKLTLTAQGKEALDYIHDRVERALDFVGQGLTEEQRTIFYAALALICENLEEYTEREAR